ncbi:hypothetical protein A3843_06770 [Pseudovibrio exalbescens]|uniref:Alpha 1,4-glycosyltransferase domain-containing protein n=2 Tax=Pseudovibrio exalbescens TaxID=197461 RepID=A0A1U7JJ83_9HYPH|nr:hypothetical protein A3843_06770 [Pseudovibrio exalbescens]
MLSCGHEVKLYTYGAVFNVPDGIEILSAEEILPKEKLIQHKATGSYALGSNLFRYQLLRRKDTIWVDTDVFLLKKIPDSEYIFGWESGQIINGAVLHMPKDSDLLCDLLNYCNARVFIAPWWPLSKKIKILIRSFYGADKKVDTVEWGVWGPKAITFFANRRNVAKFAQQQSVFYAIPIERAEEIFQPNADVSSLITEDSLALHFWNEAIKKRKSEMPPKDSLILQLCNRIGLDAADVQQILIRSKANDD